MGKKRMKNADEELNELKKLAREFYYEGKEKLAILLVHGFTASPSEMLPLGKYLHEKNYTVYGVQLAGHGTYYKDLLNYGWKDWYTSVEKAFNLLKKDYKQILPIGLSMGALLSICLVNIHKDYEFPGLILLAPAFRLKSRLASLAPLLKFVIKFRYKGKESVKYFKEHNLYSYLYRPTRSVEQLLALQKYIDNKIKEIKLPTLIFYGKKDDVISSRAIYPNSRKIFSQQSNIEIIALQNSNHILTVEPDSMELFQLIEKFLHKLK